MPPPLCVQHFYGSAFGQCLPPTIVHSINRRLSFYKFNNKKGKIKASFRDFSTLRFICYAPYLPHHFRHHSRTPIPWLFLYLADDWKDEGRSSHRFDFQNGPFHALKRAVSGCKTGRFATALANGWFSTTYRLRFHGLDLSLILALN